MAEETCERNLNRRVLHCPVCWPHGFILVDKSPTSEVRVADLAVNDSFKKLIAKTRNSFGDGTVFLRTLAVDINCFHTVVFIDSATPAVSLKKSVQLRKPHLYQDYELIEARKYAKLDAKHVRSPQSEPSRIQCVTGKRTKWIFTGYVGINTHPSMAHDNNFPAIF